MKTAILNHACISLYDYHLNCLQDSQPHLNNIFLRQYAFEQIHVHLFVL